MRQCVYLEVYPAAQGMILGVCVGDVGVTVQHVELLQLAHHLVPVSLSDCAQTVSASGTYDRIRSIFFGRMLRNSQ